MHPLFSFICLECDEPFEATSPVPICEKCSRHLGVAQADYRIGGF